MNHPTPWTVNQKCGLLLDANNEPFLDCRGAFCERTPDGQFATIRYDLPNIQVLKRIVDCVNADHFAKLRGPAAAEDKPYSMSKPYPGESGGTCVSIDCVNPHYYSGVEYNTQEEKDDAHRILNALNATAKIPNPILQSIAQHPGRLHAIAKWFKHLCYYESDAGFTCALCHTVNSHADNCPLPTILQTLDPL